MGEPAPLQIDVAELDRLRRAGERLAIVDVREAWERDICAFAESINIPMTELPERAGELPADGPLILVCHHGMRSLHATQWLRAQGRDDAINLRGGIDAWASQVDSTMKRY